MDRRFGYSETTSALVRPTGLVTGEFDSLKKAFEVAASEGISKPSLWMAAKDNPGLWTQLKKEEILEYMFLEIDREALLSKQAALEVYGSNE
jgi:hypothetical protein